METAIYLCVGFIFGAICTREYFKSVVNRYAANCGEAIVEVEKYTNKNAAILQEREKLLELLEIQNARLQQLGETIECLQKINAAWK